MRHCPAVSEAPFGTPLILHQALSISRHTHTHINANPWTRIDVYRRPYLYTTRIGHTNLLNGPMFRAAPASAHLCSAALHRHNRLASPVLDQHFPAPLQKNYSPLVILLQDLTIQETKPCLLNWRPFSSGTSQMTHYHRPPVDPPSSRLAPAIAPDQKTMALPVTHIPCNSISLNIFKQYLVKAYIVSNICI